MNRERMIEIYNASLTMFESGVFSKENAVDKFINHPEIEAMLDSEKAPFYVGCNYNGVYEYTVIYRETNTQVYSSSSEASAVEHMGYLNKKWLEDNAMLKLTKGATK